MAFKLLGGVKSYGLGFDSTAYMSGNIFELYPVVVAATVPGGGINGVIPLAPGQLQNLYQPVGFLPWRKDFKPRKIKHVGIKIKYNEDETVKEETYFLVQEPETGFTVELIPGPTINPIVTMTPVQIGKVLVFPSIPKANIKPKLGVKITKIETDEDK